MNVWDRATVGAWEHGVQQPSPRKIPLLANALGVRPLDLFELDTPPSLATLRRALGLTLMQLAGRTDRSYARCHRLEKGLLMPSSTERALLAAGLGVRKKDIQAAVHRDGHHTAANSHRRRPVLEWALSRHPSIERRLDDFHVLDAELTNRVSARWRA